jgi:hypothetical protein
MRGGDPLIIRRLDEALARSMDLGAAIVAVRVTRADHQLLRRWATHRWRRASGSKAIVHPTSFRDHPLVFGERTAILTSHGIAVAVPRRA